MKKLLLLISLFLLTACGQTKDTTSPTDTSTTNSSTKTSKTASTVNQPDFMTKTIESVHAIMENNPGILPLNEVKIDKPEYLGPFCGNTTPLEVYAGMEGTYQTTLSKESEDNRLYLTLSFNDNKELIAVNLSSPNAEDIQKILVLLEFPDFPELHVPDLVATNGAFAQYKKDDTYVNFQAYLNSTYDEAGNETVEGEIHHLSYYTGFVMKSEYQLTEGATENNMPIFREL